MNEKNGSVKALVDLALTCGRRLQSPQTGHIHYYYSSQEGEVQHTIPLFENVLFALALLRSHTVENMTEGKSMLERLLVFQDIQSGNFPLYLHEYPTCRDRFLSVRLLAPFYWILKLFGHILGKDLKGAIEKATQGLLSFSIQLHQEQILPHSLAVRLAAAQQAFGLLWSHTQWEKQGKEMLDELAQLKHVDSWHVTDYVADILVAHQMVGLNNAWDPFWRYNRQTWHPHLCSYVGPYVREEQEKSEPKAGLYDLFMGYFSGHPSSRSLIPHPYQLQAALIQPWNNKWEETASVFELKGKDRGNDWVVFHQREWSCALLEKKGLLDPTINCTYTPFCLMWGDASQTHTFVHQGGDVLVSYQAVFPTVELLFTLAENVNLGDRDKQREISFYLDFHPEAQIKVQGHASTTFELGQEVMIQSGGKVFSILFELVEGEGQFLGHIAKGNRPSQVNLKGDNRFQAYDWHLFMRTLRRKGKVCLRARIHLMS